MGSQRKIYLDYAAATPIDDRVLSAMQPYFQHLFHNPSAVYLAAKDASRALASSRHQIGQIIGCQPSEVIFTAGGTEANNLAIQGVMRHHPGSSLVCSAIEHESVLAPARLFECREAPVDVAGQVDVRALTNLIDDTTVLVSVMYANNEIGSVQPLGEIAAILQAIRRDRQARGVDLPLYLHSDACQAANYLSLHVHRLGVDLMTLNGGKVYGPKQSGVLYARAGVVMEPLMYGGGQERGLRSGTENVAGAVGFAEALSLAQHTRLEEGKRLTELQQLFVTILTKELPTVRINGGMKRRLANNLNICLPGSDNERLLMALDERGIMCASGSACNASSEEPSHVLQAIGLDRQAIRGSLRFSMGRETTKQDIIDTVINLAEIIRR